MPDLLQRLLDLAPHSSILHHTFLQILNMDILLHTNIFFHKIFQLDIHLKRDCTLKQPWKFFHIQPA